MELGALVVEGLAQLSGPLLSRAQRTEVLRGPGCTAREVSSEHYQEGEGGVGIVKGTGREGRRSGTWEPGRRTAPSQRVWQKK
eukprot:1277103-Rhodomonas_salina.3